MAKKTITAETKQPAAQPATYIQPPATVADIITPPATTIAERLSNYVEGIKAEIQNIDNEIARLKSQIAGKEEEKKKVLEVLAEFAPKPVQTALFTEPKAERVKTTRTRIGDEDILKAIGEESKSLTQLATITGTSNQTIRKKVTALVAAGKLEEFKSGVSVMVKRKK